METDGEGNMERYGVEEVLCEKTAERGRSWSDPEKHGRSLEKKNTGAGFPHLCLVVPTGIEPIS